MMKHSPAHPGRGAVDERAHGSSTPDDAGDAHTASGPTGDRHAEAPKGFLGLTIPQLLGGAFAAVSTAVVASFLGVAGTLIGAALGSIVSTVSAAVYTTMATNAQRRVRRVATRPGQRPRGGATAADVARGPSEASSGPLSSTGSARSAPTAAGGRRFDVAAIRRSVKPRRLLAATAVVFAIAIGLVTALEIGLGRPVSASSAGPGESGRTGTSLSQVVQGVSGQDAPTDPADAPTPAETPADGVIPGQEATPGPGPTDGGSDGAPANPEGGPTAEPTAPADGSGDSVRPTEAPTQGDTGGNGDARPADPTPQAPAPTGGGGDAGSGQAG